MNSTVANLSMFLKPKPTLSDQDVRHGLRMMTWEGIASLAMFSITTSGLLAGFVLALGANNLQIGILAAIPFIMQLLQIPSLWLVEQLRWRKAISVLSWLPAQLIWVLVALIPFYIGVPSQAAVGLLLGLMVVRGLLSAVTNCSWNSWIRDLVPQSIMGSFFSQRLASGTVASIVFGLAGAFFIDFWGVRASPAEEIFGYAYVLLAGALFLGLASPWFLSRIAEPLMRAASGPRLSLKYMLFNPLQDRNFRQLVNFLFFWGFAANLAVPFFTIYMLQQLGFPLSAVIALNTLSQLAFVLFLRVWGSFVDRFGSKAVLSLSASLYLLAIVGWTFTTLPDIYFLTIPLVIVLQIFAGVAAAGVNLTMTTTGLKLAPQEQATSYYMVVASLATNIGAGLGPLAGGLLADFFSGRQFSIAFGWTDATDATQNIEFPAVHLAGFDFLFTIAFLIGLITLKTLTTIKEEGEVGREEALEELLAPSREMARTIGAIPGLRILGGFPFAYLRHIPGVDVALGVTAYEIASSVKTAATAARRGERVVADISSQVSRAVARLVGETEVLGGQGIYLARHAARGVMHASEEVPVSAGHLTREGIIGILEALKKASIDPLDAIWEVSYGAVQGADEVGADVAEVATQTLAGAKEAARGLGLPENEVVVQVT
jgi:MFS family permease